MDYLDHKKERQHRILLMTGYVLIGIAIVFATLILLYQAYGFGVTRKGEVVQNGLVFFSSQPNPADIRLNGELKPRRTNARMVLPAGVYQVNISRDGYKAWNREITLHGGQVKHYDYPFLFPNTLTTNNMRSYSSAPGFMTQSPDHRWLLIQAPGDLNSFVVYDLQNPQDAATPIELPGALLTKAKASEAWKLVEWADNNRHVLLQHEFDGKQEYVLVDRITPGESVNLSTTLKIKPSKMTLGDRKYNKYFIYDANTRILQTATLREPTPVNVLEKVITYKTYADDTILYITDTNSPAGKVSLKMKVGNKTYQIRNYSAGTTYVIDLTKYDGVMYVAAGATSENKVYVFKDPAGQLDKLPSHAASSARVLHVPQVNYLSFSANAQFIVAENGNNFAVYDIENEEGYRYTTTAPLDPPQANATWMDGNRLVYVSGGKLQVFDYDNLNQQTLVAASSGYMPAFSPDYDFVYVLAPGVKPGEVVLTETSLLSAQDQ